MSRKDIRSLPPTNTRWKKRTRIKESRYPLRQLVELGRIIERSFSGLSVLSQREMC
jgi:hypothetical protein